MKVNFITKMSITALASFYLAGCAAPPDKKFSEADDILTMGTVLPAPQFQSGSGRALNVVFERMLNPGVAEFSVPGTGLTRVLRLEYVKPTSTRCVEETDHSYIPPDWGSGVKKNHAMDTRHQGLEASEACSRFHYLEGKPGILTIYEDDWQNNVSRGELRVEGVNIGLTYVAEGFLDLTRRGQLREHYQLAQSHAIERGAGIWKARIDNHELQKY